MYYLEVFVYFLIPANTPSYVDVIDKAIKQFSDYTCLKWVPYGSDEANKTSYSSYIEFFSERYTHLTFTKYYCI